MRKHRRTANPAAGSPVDFIGGNVFLSFPFTSTPTKSIWKERYFRLHFRIVFNETRLYRYFFEYHIDPLFSRGNFSGQCMWRWNKRSNQVSMMSDRYPTCSPDLSYCPDNMCDELEQLDPRICPQDCTVERKFLIFFYIWLIFWIFNFLLT